MTQPPPDIEAQRRAEWEGTWTAADYLRDASDQQAEWNDAMAQEARDARNWNDVDDRPTRQEIESEEWAAEHERDWR